MADWEAIRKILARENALGIDHIPINHYWNDEKQEWNKTPYAGYDLNAHYEYKAYSTMEELEEAYYQEKGCEAYAIRLGKLRDSNNEYIVGIDVDNAEYALLIDNYLKDHSLDTMKEVTPRGGMHFYYLLPEDTRIGGIGGINGIHTTTPTTPTPITTPTTTIPPTPTPTTPTINMLDLAKNTTLDIKLYLEKRYFIHIAKKYQIINGVDKITTLTPDSLDKINDTLSKIIRLTVALKDYYIEGKRDYLWLYLSGYMYKLNVELEEALIICRYVCLFFKDEELKSRLAVVKETYSKDKDKKKEIKGIEGLKELGLSSTILQQIQSIFKSKNSNNNNGNNTNTNTNNNINNNNKDIITTEYTYVCQFLLAEREAGIERSLFIDNYRYVCEKDKGGYWIYWDKGVWSAEYAEMKLAKDLLDYCKSVIIEELQSEEFKEELGYFIQVTKSKSTLKELMATLSIFLNIPDKLLDSLPDNIILTKNCAIEISISASNSNNTNNNNNNNNNNTNNNNNNTNTTEIETKVNVNVNININVKTLPLEEVKEYYPTRRLDVEYDPNAKCDRFREFLLTICNNNIEKANFLIKLMGLFLQRRKEEYCFIFYGSGANGKSTLLKVITSMLGDYARYSNISMINAREEEGKNPELIACKDKHLICIFEPKQVYLNTANLKAITSLEPKSVRPLYRVPIEVIPDFHLVIATNNKPIITEFTLGMLRRLVMVKFDHIIPEKERISNYADILLEERSGILNLMLTGLQKVMQEEEGRLSLTIPDVIKRETAEWLWEIDSLQEFVDRYLEMTYNDKDRIRFSTVYEKYKFFLQLKGREIEEAEEIEEENRRDKEKEGEGGREEEREGGREEGEGGEGREEGEEKKKVLTKVAFSKRMRDLGFTTEKIDKVTYLCKVRWKVAVDNINNNNDNNSSNNDNSSSSGNAGVNNSNSNSNSNNNNNSSSNGTNSSNGDSGNNNNTNNYHNNNDSDKNNNNNNNYPTQQQVLNRLTVEESRKVFEHIEKHYYDHDNFYICKHCGHKHTPLTICGQGVKIMEFRSLPDNITLGEDQYNRLVELAMHADLCYTYNTYYKKHNPNAMLVNACCCEEENCCRSSSSSSNSSSNSSSSSSSSSSSNRIANANANVSVS